MENYTAWKSETARKSSLNLVINQAKAKEVETVRLIENVSPVDALVTSERITEPRLISMEDTPNLHAKEKVLEVVREEKQRPHIMCHWGPLGDDDEFLEDATGIDATAATCLLVQEYRDFKA